MKRTIMFVILALLAGLAAWGRCVLPARLDNLLLTPLNKSHELLGYDLISDRYGLKDSRAVEDIVKELQAFGWTGRRDEAGSVILRQQVYKWPMRYDYTLRVTRPAQIDPADQKKIAVSTPADFIEIWYLVDGSLQWFHKAEPVN